MKLIDAHVHTEFSLERLMNIHDSYKYLDLKKEKFLEDIKSLEIDYVLSIGKKDGKLRTFFEDSESDLAELIDEQQKYPFLKKIMAVNLSEKGNLQQIEKYLEKGLVEGIKFYLGYTIDEPNNKILEPYYELASEFDVPMLFHLGECYHWKAEYLVHPSCVIPTLEKYPEQKFLLCHLGYPLIDETEKILKKFDNAFTDLSGIMTFEDIRQGECNFRLGRVKPVLERLLDKPKTRKKVMYGSDYPLVALKQYKNIIKSIVPSEFHHKVFYENAKDLFKLI